MKNCHPKTEQMKAEYLEHLYVLDGRKSKNHPMHGLYGNLWQAHMKECAEEARLAWWDLKDIDHEAFDR